MSSLKGLLYPERKAEGERPLLRPRKGTFRFESERACLSK